MQLVYEVMVSRIGGPNTPLSQSLQALTHYENFIY